MTLLKAWKHRDGRIIDGLTQQEQYDAIDWLLMDMKVKP